MKKFISIALTIVMVLSMVGCGQEQNTTVREINHVIGDEKKAEEPEEAANEAANEVEMVEPVDNEKLLSGLYTVLIEIEGYGDITVELDADAAPITVTNFMNLVHDDFYSGLTFHRIIEGFMMQGGESKDKIVFPIKGEFALNGVNNPISHERGVISMARANDPNSADSQFFICHQDSTFLDGSYAAFGHVVSGMDVVDRVCEEAVVVDNNGTVPPENQPVIKSITDVTE